MKNQIWVMNSRYVFPTNKQNTKVQGRRLGMYSCGIRVYISEEEMLKAEKEDQAYIQTEEGFRRTKMMQQVEIGL